MKCFESRAGQVFWVVGIFAALLILSGTAYGSSKKWRANNNSDVKVKVFWTALGCAGQKPACKWGGDLDIYAVCKTKHLKPGESSYYKFKDGTSDRRKEVCRMDGESHGVGDIDKTYKRKHNGIRLNADGAADWYDE